LEIDCHGLDITLNLELLVTFGPSLKGICHELDKKFHYKLVTNFEGPSCDKKFLEKAPSKLGMRKLWGCALAENLSFVVNKNDLKAYKRALDNTWLPWTSENLTSLDFEWSGNQWNLIAQPFVHFWKVLNKMAAKQISYLIGPFYIIKHFPLYINKSRLANHVKTGPEIYGSWFFLKSYGSGIQMVPLFGCSLKSNCRRHSVKSDYN
jgi:hypothetical protein